MKPIYLIVFLSILVTAFICTSCEDMDEKHKQYTYEYNYSGKINDLRCYIGFERIDLAWDNPTDQKSKSIYIFSATDEKEYFYETLVDSVTLNNLTSGSGYEFYVYTVDNSGNLSVPVSITALPVSADFVNSLVPSSCHIYLSDENEYLIKWTNLSSIIMRFTGRIEYTITGSDGTTSRGDINLELEKTEIISEYEQVVEELRSDVEYTIQYTTYVWPISGSEITLDAVSISNEIKTIL